MGVVRVWVISVLCCWQAGCSVDLGGSLGGIDCDPTVENVQPAAPTITVPAAGRLDVLASDFTIAGSPFFDPDGADEHVRSEFEIWQLDGSEPMFRVWSASIQSPDPLLQVETADGDFDPLFFQLEPWTDYGARVRYMDSSQSCSAQSEWSDYRKFRTDDGSSYLFDDSRIHTIYLDIPEDSWDAMNAQSHPPGCVPYSRDYQVGSLRFEDQVFEGVGIKIKGGCGSARKIEGKSSFKVHLSWDNPAVSGCPETRRLHGEKRFTLNNMVQDDTMLHERIGYTFYRAMGVPTPRTAHVRVYLNNEYWGLYLHVETIDRRFLSRWFASNDGMLYEGTYWCDLIPENVPPTLDDSYCLTREFIPDVCTTPAPGADPSDYTLLRELTLAIDALPPGGFYPQITDIFDFDRFLSSWAVDSVLAHWDGYEFRIKNNYRVYHDPSTDKWTIIPTGIDQTFVLRFDPWERAEAVLAARCLEEPDCEAAYAQRVSQAVAVFEQLQLATVAEQAYEQIEAHAFEDRRKPTTDAEFTNANVSVFRPWIITNVARIRSILTQHGF